MTQPLHLEQMGSGSLESLRLTGSRVMHVVKDRQGLGESYRLKELGL